MIQDHSKVNGPETDLDESGWEFLPLQCFATLGTNRSNNAALTKRGSWHWFELSSLLLLLRMGSLCTWMAWRRHFDPWIATNTLPHQAGIELLDFHARGWKSDQGGRNSMQEMHGNQTKCMEFRPIKENSNFWTSIFCPGINFSCSKSLWIWWTIDPLILACLKLMTYASFSTKQLLAVLMDGNPCNNGWNSMHQNRRWAILLETS